MCGKTEAELLLTGVENSCTRISFGRTCTADVPDHAGTPEYFRPFRWFSCFAIFDEAGNLDSSLRHWRHNAVDKAIGQLMLNGTLEQAFCIIVSGRVSYEIVSRPIVRYSCAGCRISSPFMAVESCRSAGITLLAFCRMISSELQLIAFIL